MNFDMKKINDFSCFLGRSIFTNLSFFQVNFKYQNNENTIYLNLDSLGQFYKFHNSI